MKLLFIGDIFGSGNHIYGFRLNPATGSLTLLPGFPFATGGTGSGVTGSEMVAYGNGRLYALNDGSNTLSVFDTSTPTSPALIATVAAGAQPTGVAFGILDPRLVYVSNQAGDYEMRLGYYLGHQDE